MLRTDKKPLKIVDLGRVSACNICIRISSGKGQKAYTTLSLDLCPDILESVMGQA